MKKLLLIIDLQKSFINKNTESLVEKIQDLVKKNNYDKIVFTKFINNKNSIYYKKLGYTGCIKEEDGEIVINTYSNKVIGKSTYTAFNKELKNYLKMEKISDVYLCGIDTECCVLKTAFDLFEAGYNTYILEDYCGCTHGTERHKSAIEILRRNIGQKYVI